MKQQQQDYKQECDLLFADETATTRLQARVWPTVLWWNSNNKTRSKSVTHCSLMKQQQQDYKQECDPLFSDETATTRLQARVWPTVRWWSWSAPDPSAAACGLPRCLVGPAPPAVAVTVTFIIRHQHTLSCISIYYHTQAYIITHKHTLSYISIHYHSPAYILSYISIPYHTSTHTAAACGLPCCLVGPSPPVEATLNITIRNVIEENPNFYHFLYGPPWFHIILSFQNSDLKKNTPKKAEAFLKYSVIQLENNLKQNLFFN